MLETIVGTLLAVVSIVLGYQAAFAYAPRRWQARNIADSLLWRFRWYRRRQLMRRLTGGR